MLSVIDLTKEVQVCHRCQKERTDDAAANHERWQRVEAQSMKEVVLICHQCVDHYYEKKAQSEYIKHHKQPHTYSRVFTGTSGEPSSSHTMSQALPVWKLVADSQPGIGAWLVTKNHQY